MELMNKQGFKQTEVGLIPEDWSVEAIGNLGSISTGGSDTQDRVDDGFYPFFVRSQTIERINKYSFDGEAILTSGDGVGVGKIFHYVNCKFDYHQRVYNIHNYRSDVCGKYLFFQFSTNFYDRVMAMTARSSVDSVRREMIADMKIPLPPTLTEQKAIATALSDVDALIANLDKLIVKKKAIKQGAMQQLLMPNDTWINTSLIELADNKKNQFDDGDWIESEYIISQGVRLIQTGNIGIGVFKDKGNKKYISEESFIKLNCKEVLEGDLLICRLAEPAGRACVMPNIGEDKVVTSVDVSIFRGDERIVNRRFLSHFFTTNQWFNQVIERVGGTTHKRISRGALGQIEFFIPKIEEQNKIAQILSDMDAEIDVLESKKAKYQDIKKGMMQELLTGKTRLV